MKVIKKRKTNYEIYDMEVNPEKAKLFREKMVENLEFYRLVIDTGKYRGELYDIINNAPQKRIYELLKFPINEQKCFYGDYVTYTKDSQYELTRYNDKWTREITLDIRDIGKTEQKVFKEQFAEEGLINYRYFLSQYAIRDIESYIFLDSWNGFGEPAYKCCENVVSLPKEITAEYLLEKGFGKSGMYFDRIDENNQKQIMESFEINHSSNLTQKQYEDLVNLKLIEEETFTRKLQLDSPITHFIK